MRPFALLSVFALILSAPLAAAPRVLDNAHLMTEQQVAQLSSNIGSRPIYVETEQSIAGDLKAYADGRVSQLSEGRKAVVIIVTVSPHAWRISTYPKGFLAGTQNVGDTMASLFRQGRVFDGLNGAARTIDQMVTRPTTSHSTSTTTTTTSTTRQVRPAYQSVDWVIVWWIIGLCVGVPLVIWLVYLIIEACSRPAVRETVYVREPASRTPIIPREVNQSTAQTYYDQYSPAQRQSIINNYSSSPGYRPGLYNDPMQFYMFLMTMNALTSHPYYGGGYGGGYGGYAAPAQDTTTTTTTESRSDDSGSGGGWGASPTPDRSDDSGSGGSWGSSSSSDSSSSSSSDSGSSWGSSDSGGSSSDSGSSGGDSGGSW